MRGEGGTIMKTATDALVPARASSRIAIAPPALRDHRPLALAVPPGRTGSLLAALGPALADGLALYCLDGGNAFDPLRLAAQLRRAGIPPAPILAERLFVSRAFTCHQLAGAVTQLLAPLAEQEPRPLAMILGVERLFLDEDISFFERRHLFGRILENARALARRGLPILVTCGAERADPWLAALKSHTDFLPGAAQAVAAMRRIADGPHPADLQHLA